MAKEANSKNNRHFWKDFKAELKKVIWPTPKQVVNSTSAVITIVLLTAIIVFILDVTFETLNKQGVNRLKSVVSNISTSENNTTDNETEKENNEADNQTAEESNTQDNTTSNETENNTAENNEIQNNEVEE